MSTESRRYRVSDLGFAFAVHDTRVGQEYDHPAGKGKAHPSTNALNSVRVGIYATREMAQSAADELNEKHERERRAG